MYPLFLKVMCWSFELRCLMTLGDLEVLYSKHLLRATKYWLEVQTIVFIYLKPNARNSLSLGVQYMSREQNLFLSV